MVETLLTIFPNHSDLLALEPEELGGVILETAEGITQNGMFNIYGFMGQLFKSIGDSYPHGINRSVELALAEALSWLQTEGLVVREPRQPSDWYAVTRRGRTLPNRADVEVHRKARILPVDLLQPTLAEKVWPLFLRGDHDIAVFQAFKDVEVAVRQASNAKGAGYTDDLVGIGLMRKAFHPDTGPLRDNQRVPAERDAEMHLFSGAIGTIRNRVGHHDVNLPPQEAARLIVFASHLLEIVERRT